MLPRQPLRFLLADDPGAGKTIMAGLLIKELIVRGDLQRCLIVCPGQPGRAVAGRARTEASASRSRSSPATRSRRPAAATRSPRTRLVICRLDKLSRNEDVQAKLEQTDWDLDRRATRRTRCRRTSSAARSKDTKRYQLGELLGGLTRHFLLMTATPHNGKEEDFQLFMALLDADRFEGKFRDGVHRRRRVGPDAPDGQGGAAHVRGQAALPRAARLHGHLPALDRRGASSTSEVTEYVREEMNRADALKPRARAAGATSSGSR